MLAACLSDLMDVKSWQIALAGTLTQFGALDYAISASTQGGFEAALGFLFELAVLFIGGLCTILLCFEQTKKIGAIASMIYGTIIMFLIVANLGVMIVGGVLGAALIAAGAYYFWKNA